MASFKMKVSLPDSMLYNRGMDKLGILSGEDLEFYLCWISLSTKISINGSMYLVAEMITDAKR